MIKSGISFFFLVAALFTAPALQEKQDIIKVTESHVEFTSNAPLEIIQAETDAMAGLIDMNEGTFAFSIPMVSFIGFNSPLQMEHFHENYMESNKYPNATYQGRIIEDIDFNEHGTINIRTKGILNIHGQEQERIIPSEITISDKNIRIRAEFIVPLSDHDISIPKIVEQKIAREISIILDATFQLDTTP